MAGATAPRECLVDIAEFIFTEASFDARLKTIRWLQARNLLATQMTCSCAGNMILIKRDFSRGKQDDKWAWRCPECTSIKSIRSGSWFEGIAIATYSRCLYWIRGHLCFSLLCTYQLLYAPPPPPGAYGASGGDLSSSMCTMLHMWGISFDANLHTRPHFLPTLSAWRL